MFSKLSPMIVTIFLASFFAAKVNAGDFTTSKATEDILAKAKTELTVAQKNGWRFDEAESLLQQAAKEGSEEAYLILGRIYTRHPEKKNFAAAKFWLTQAADQGSTKAMANLAVIYLDGRVVEPDPSKATYWLQRGSDAGDLDATFNLADFYMQGTGVPADSAKGIRLMQDAALKGHAFSIDFFVEQAQKGNREARQFLKNLQPKPGYDTEAFKQYRAEAN